MKNYFPNKSTPILQKKMLIQPFFVDQRLKSKKIIKGMGNNYSWSQSTIIKEIESDLKKGIKNFLLFIVPKEKQKPPDGHCGISHKRKIDLNQTHYALGLAANTYLEAGADIIAPSDMMKNTTRYLRKIFQDNNFSNAQIMSYSTKFKSSFYGPFRNAANSSPKGFDRSSYQLPVNHRKKAVESSIVNAAQGANYLMVKPGMTSIDLITDIKKETLLPTGAYQVSGEFASLQLLHKNKLGNYQDLLFESLQVFARAKADFIITYGARDIAKYL